METTAKHPTKSPKLLAREEMFNSISHGLGIALSIAALVLLIVRSSGSGSAKQIVTCTIYGVSMVLLYSASTIFHGAKNLRRKVMYNRLDHAAIYLLIAGTYTPFTLITMKGTWGWSIFAVQWGLAIAGVIFKLFFYSKKYRKLSAFLYLVMGWAGMAGLHLLIANLPTMGLVWLGLGAMAYSLGVIFYLQQHKPFAHGIFHIFILAGSIFHFFSVLLYVV